MRNARKYKLPDLHFAHYGEALTYDSLKRPEKAKLHLQQALNINPDFGIAKRKYAEITGKSYDIASAEGENGNTSSGLPKAQAPSPSLINASASGSEFSWQQGTSIVTGATNSAVQDKKHSKKLTYRYPGIEGQTPKPPLKSGTKTAKIVASSGQQISNKSNKLGKLALVPPPGFKVNDDKSIVKFSEQDNAPSAEPKKAEKIATSPWLIQISSQREEQAAHKMWKKLKKRHTKILSGTNAVVQRADLGKKGIFWRVRLTGYESKKAAVNQCTKLKRNRLSCFVVKAG